jgi:hypothetical protein
MTTRAPRGRIHRWEGRDAGDHFTRWTCQYCGAECETDASKWFPGSHPMVDVYYRPHGDTWCLIERMPACPDTLRVPMYARAFIRANMDLDRETLANHLGVKVGTSWSWRDRIRRVDLGLTPKPTERTKKILGWRALAAKLGVGPLRAKQALVAAGTFKPVVTLKELLDAMAEWDKRPAVQRGLRSVQNAAMRAQREREMGVRR